MWLFLSLLSGTFYTASGIIARHLLKGEKDSWAYSFWFSMIGSIVVLPFAIFDFEVPKSQGVWVMFVTMCGITVLHNYLTNKSMNFIGPTIQGAITKFRLVWILFLGVFLLSETFSYGKLIGTLLTIGAGMVIIGSFKRQKNVMKGALVSFCATFIYAIVITSNSFFFKYYSALSLTFFIFFVGAILNFVFMPNAERRIKKFIKTDTLLVILATSLSGFGFLSLVKALSIGEQSEVVVVTESFLFITLLGESIILKDRSKLIFKLLAVAMAITGAVLVQVNLN